MHSPVADPRAKALLQLLRPFNVFLDRPDVTEVAVNRPGEILALTFKGWESHEAAELTMGALKALTTAIATYNSMAERPIMSVLLPGGQRGQIAHAPAVIEGGVSLNIRKHSSVVRTLDELSEQGAFANWSDVSFNRPTEAEALAQRDRADFNRLQPFEVELLALKRERRIIEFLEQIVLHKRNLVIAGKTGSGKTTFARSLIEKIPSEERLVTIEDVHELGLQNHPNRVHMLYGNTHGRMSADECLAACMRMSPDRILLAELRGNEAWEYLNSLNTGHPGSITTTHANNALQTFERIGTLVKKSDVGRQLDMEMIKTVLQTTIDVVLYFHDRKLVEVFYDPIFARSKIA